MCRREHHARDDRVPKRRFLSRARAGSGRDAHMRMQQRLNAPEGRELYRQRFATVEPVYGNMLYDSAAVRLQRFVSQLLRPFPRLRGSPLPEVP